MISFVGIRVESVVDGEGVDGGGFFSVFAA